MAKKPCSTSGDDLTKADLINHISERAGITRVKAETVVNAIFDSMVEALMRNDRIEIRGFGSFVNRLYGGLPRDETRERVKLLMSGKRNYLFLRFGKELKEDINGAD